MERCRIDPIDLCSQENHLIICQWCNPFILYDFYIPDCIVIQLQIKEKVAPFPRMPKSLIVKIFSSIERSRIFLRF